MSLEISTDIFSHSKNVSGNFHRHLSSVETSPTFIGTVEMPGAGNFHRHFSLSQNVAGNFHRHFFLSQLKCRWKFPPTFSLTAKMSLEISTATFLHWKLHQHLSAQLKCPALEISTDIFLSQPKCRWKFPSTFFSVTAKMSLEISTDIFFHSQSAAENFHRHFSSHS